MQIAGRERPGEVLRGPDNLFERFASTFPWPRASERGDRKIGPEAFAHRQVKRAASPRCERDDGDVPAFAAGLRDVRAEEIVARADYADFEDFWSPFTLGVGPIGLHYESLDDTQRKAVRSECRRLLNPPESAFTLQAACWFAAGRVPNHGE